MGLAQNISTIEARQALNMARAIGIAFGSAEQIERTVYGATGNAELAFQARVRAEHERASVR